MTKDKKTIGELLDTKAHPFSTELQEIGIKIGKLYTDHGLPLDISLDRLPHTKEQKLSILDGACQWFIEHKRLSGATDKSIERQRASNRKMVEEFIATDETGVY